MSEAMPDVRNAQALPWFSAWPERGVPNAVPSQPMKPSLASEAEILASTAAESTRMKMNGQLAAIQPIVPHSRTGPKSFCGSLRLAKAIVLVTEIVGTKNRQCTAMQAKNSQKFGATGFSGRKAIHDR